ncbi:MAG: AEC family transporter [Clostridiales bacterium]|nr:AEC family transporter [Clostridiales bacterium]
MAVFQKMASTQVLLFMYMLIGVLCNKTHIITKDTRKHFNNLLIYITLPATVFSSFLNNITSEEISQGGLMLLLSAGICIASYGLSLLLWHNKSPNKKTTLQFSTVFSNAGNAGIPVASMVFGNLGTLMASFFLIPIQVFIWTLGIALYMPKGNKHNIKKILFNPCLISIVLGMLLFATNLKAPSFLVEGIRTLGNITGPLSMMIIGSTLAEIKPQNFFDKDSLLICFVRLLSIPLALVGILQWISIPAPLWQIAVTLSAMPIAFLAAVFSETHGKDHAFASKCIFLSTLFSLVTVPLISLLF